MSTATAEISTRELSPELKLFEPVSIPAPNKPRRVLRLLQADPNCFYCRTPLTKSESSIDHVVPTSRGGTNKGRNKRLCCHRCNGDKSDMTPCEWLADLIRRRDELIELVDRLTERVETDGLERFVAPLPRPIGKKGKAGFPSGPSVPMPSDYIERHVFEEGKSTYQIVSLATGRTLIRGLRLQMAVHFLREIGPDDSLGLVDVKPVYHPELGLVPPEDDSDA